MDADDGLCLDCSGAVEKTVHIYDPHVVEERRVCESCRTRYRVIGTMYGDTCKSLIGSPAFVHVLAHPALTTFYGNRGVEHGWPSWEGFARAHEYDLMVVSEAPIRVCVSVRADGDELRLMLDGRSDVVATSP